LKILTVVGARPEFIQIAPVDQEIRRRHEQILVHTGQHYDDAMSHIFFKELNIHTPEHNLEVGSGSHAVQTGMMMIKLEEIMLQEKPDFVIAISDTNSTVATAMAATKLNLPLAHIEAGLRSYDRTMPEEINRIITDHISDVLFPPTQVAVDNLKQEGITSNVFHVGDVRMDTVYDALEPARQRLGALLSRSGLAQNTPFALATIHRAGNTDREERLRGIIQVLGLVEMPVVLPVHPRLAKMMQTHGLTFSSNIHAIEPISFLNTIALLDACQFVITDSGGLQKEAYMLRKPGITIRESTEWTETVTSGWNRLSEPVPDAFRAALAGVCGTQPTEHPNFYGTYGVSRRIVDALETVHKTLKHN
jgi:UDP-N-acetylglucosamine 2-epimerase